MTGTGRAITSTPLREQIEPKIFPAIVLGTMSPYLREGTGERENTLSDVSYYAFNSICLSLIQRLGLHSQPEVFTADRQTLSHTHSSRCFQFIFIRLLHAPFAHPTRMQLPSYLTQRKKGENTANPLLLNGTVKPTGSSAAKQILLTFGGEDEEDT